MPPDPFFHEDSSAVRFWVLTPASTYVGATIGRSTLRHVYEAGKPTGTEPVALYLQHRREIDDAVLRRCASGSIEPVMLREADLPPARRY